MAKNQYFEHPKFKELLLSGSTEEESTHTFQIYLDLTEGKGWWNVEIVRSHNQLFIRGHETQFHDPSIVIPCSAQQTLTPSQLQSCLSTLAEEFNVQCALLAFIDADSTTVYYQVAIGLIPPERPEEMEAKKQTRFRYQQRRKRRNIKFKDVYETMEAKALLSAEQRDAKQATEDVESKP